MRIRRLAADIALIALGAIFLFAAIDKSLAIQDFRLVVSSHVGRLPDSLVSGITMVVLAWEASLGLLLITGIRPRVAAATAIVTLLAFTLILVNQWMAPTPPESCGCGRLFTHLVQREAIAPVGVVRNLVLIGLAAFGFIVCRRAAAESNPVSK